MSVITFGKSVSLPEIKDLALNFFSNSSAFKMPLA